MKLPSADSLKKERQIREGIESSLAEIILKAVESEQTSVSIDLEDFEGDKNYLGTNYSKVVEILETKDMDLPFIQQKILTEDLANRFRCTLSLIGVD